MHVCGKYWEKFGGLHHSCQSLFLAINTFRVDDPNTLSDHCLIHFSLLLLAHDGANGQNVDAGSGSSLDYKYI